MNKSRQLYFDIVINVTLRMVILMPFSCLPIEGPVISPAIQSLKWKRCMVYALKLLIGN